MFFNEGFCKSSNETFIAVIMLLLLTELNEYVEFNDKGEIFCYKYENESIDLMIII